MRLVNGTEGGGEGVSGLDGGGFVRARAILHALAPRSRTWGKARLMSCSSSGAYISIQQRRIKR